MRMKNLNIILLLLFRFVCVGIVLVSICLQLPLCGTEEQKIIWSFSKQIFLLTDGVSTKMHQNNVFTVAKRNLEGQDMIYQAVKFTNNVWALTELKLQPGNPNITVNLKHLSNRNILYFLSQDLFR